MNRLNLPLRTLALAGVALAAAFTGPLPAQGTRIDTTFAFNRTGDVNLSLPAGEIRVTAWNRSEARVVATSERGVISTSFSADRMRLEVRTRSGDRDIGRTRYDVTVPAGVKVNASVASGTIDVSGTRGELSLSSASGTINASDGAGRSEIESASGHIVLQRFEGTTSVSAMSGRVEVTDITGDLTVEVITGTVKVDHASLSGLHVETVSGTLDYAGALQADSRNELKTISGGITLRLPAGQGATIELSSFRGALQSPDFPVTLQPSAGSTRGRNSERQQYEINGGGARIAVETFSGGIVLRKLTAVERR